jgi:hypothetical protein
MLPAARAIYSLSNYHAGAFTNVAEKFSKVRSLERVPNNLIVNRDFREAQDNVFSQAAFTEARKPRQVRESFWSPFNGFTMRQSTERCRLRGIVNLPFD